MLSCEVVGGSVLISSSPSSSANSYASFIKPFSWKEIDQFGHEQEIQFGSDPRYRRSCDGSLIILSAKSQQLFACMARNVLTGKVVRSSSPFLLKSKSRSTAPVGGDNPDSLLLAPKPILTRNLLCNDDDDGKEDGGNKIRRELLCLAVGNPAPAFR